MTLIALIYIMVICMISGEENAMQALHLVYGVAGR